MRRPDTAARRLCVGPTSPGASSGRLERVRVVVSASARQMARGQGLGPAGAKVPESREALSAVGYIGAGNAGWSASVRGTALFCYSPVIPSVGAAPRPRAHRIRHPGGVAPGANRKFFLDMNTRELVDLDHWDEAETARLVAEFVRRFRRLPGGEELVQFRQASSSRLRIPRQSRRVLATLIATL